MQDNVQWAMQLGGVRRIWNGTCVALSGGFLLVAGMWLLTQPAPLQDLPEWINQGALLSRLWQGDPVVTAAVHVVSWPVPNSTSQLLIAALCLVMPPFVAARVLVLLYLTSGAIVSWLLAKRFNREHAPQVGLVLLSGVFLGSTFWNGYTSFVLALNLIGLFVLLDSRTVRPIGLTLLFSLLIFFSHGGVYLCFLTYVGARAVMTRKELVQRLAAVVPSLGLFAAYVLLKSGPATELGPSRVAGFAQEMLFRAYGASKVGSFRNIVDAQGESARENLGTLGMYLGITSNVAFGVVLLVSCLSIAHRVKRRDDVRQSAAALTIVGLVLVAWSLPPVFLNVNNLGERIMYCVAIVVCTLPVRAALLHGLAALTATGMVLTLLQLPAVDRPDGGEVIAATPTTCRGVDCYFAHRLYQFDGITRAYAQGGADAEPRLRFYTSLLIPNEPR